MDQRFAGGVEALVAAVRGEPAGADFGDRAHAADGRDGMARGAARAVERRPEPFLGGLDLEEVVATEAELLELSGGDAGQGIAGQRRPRLRDEDTRRGEDQGREKDSARGSAHHFASLSGSTATIVPRMKPCPAPQIREHSNVYLPALAGVNVAVIGAAPALRDLDVDALALDAEAVRRVVALEHDRQRRADGDLDLRGLEGEAFGGHFDGLFRPAAPETAARSETAARAAGSRERHRPRVRPRHQNHHPNPTFRPFGARTTLLWLRAIT